MRGSEVSTSVVKWGEV